MTRSEVPYRAATVTEPLPRTGASPERITRPVIMNSARVISTMIQKLLPAALLVCLAPGATIPKEHLLPGMPPILDPNDIYAADHAGQLSPVVKNFPPRVYVPNTESNTVSVIDPETYKVIETWHVGRQPQHV